MENIVNNYEFAKLLDAFKAIEIIRLEKQVDEAFIIISDINYKWKDDNQKKSSQVRFDQMKTRLAWLLNFHKEGGRLVEQHEAMTNLLSKIYDYWYNNISNEGKQETEMMEMQADCLNEIFVSIYKALKPLNLDIKPPKALNL
jgi:hypothetical protein